MTITTNSTRDEYTATASQTVFNFNFKIYTDQDLDVYVTPAGNVADDSTDLTTAYVIDPSSIGTEAGGFLTLTTPATLNDLVTIVSSIVENRTVDYQNNGDFRPPVVNSDFDRSVSLIKQISDEIGRRPQFQSSEQGVTALTLPAPVANKGVFWKPDLSGLENTTEDLDGITDAAAASAAAAAASAESAATSAALADAAGGSPLYIGNISNPLVDLKLKNSIDFTGVGTPTFTRASSATYVDRYGVVQTAANDEIRFEAGGALLEGASTNELLNSDTPVTQTPTITAGTFTLWVVGTGDATVSYGTATEGSPLTFTSSGEALLVTVNGSLARFQLEELPFPSSYISTIGAPVARAADVLMIPQSGNVDSNLSTIVLDYRFLGFIDSSQRAVRLAGTAGNVFISPTSGGDLRGRYGGTDITLDSPLMAGKQYRTVLVYDNSAATTEATQDGVKLTGATAQSFDVDTTGNIGIGNDGVTEGESMYGHVSRLQIFDRTLSEFEASIV